MSQKVDSNEKSFTADAAIGQNKLVRMTATGVDVCGIAHHAIGTATREAFAAGDVISVKLTTAATAYRIGKCLEAAGADGDVIEVLYLSDGAAAS